MLGHKTSLNKFKKIDSYQACFLNHKGIIPGNQLQEENWKRKKQLTDMWRLSNLLLNKQNVNRETKKNSEISWKEMKMEIQQTEINGMQQKCFKREVCSNKYLNQGTAKVSNK